MKRFLLASLMGMLISTLAFGVDIKSQIGTQDLNVDTDGAAHGTFQRRTSTGGTITLDKIDGNQIPWSTDYTRTIRPHDITGHSASPGRIQGFSFGSASYTDNGYFQDIITKSPYVDVRAYGSALTEVPIQAAINALDNTVGGTIFIPAGTYVISTQISAINKSNVRIIGAGKGRTILDSSAATWSAAYTSSWQQHFGTLTFDTNSSATYVSGIYVSDLTVLSNISDTDADRKGIFFGNVKDVTVERVKMQSVYWESINWISNNLASSTNNKRIRVTDCDFINLAKNGIDYNSWVEDSILSGNIFDNVGTAINAATGHNLIITNNIVRGTSGQRAIAVASDAADTASPRTKSVIISNNSIYGVGKYAPAAGGPTHYDGIAVTNNLNLFYDNGAYGSTFWDNNSYDTPVLITNNLIADSDAKTGNTIFGFNIAARAKLSNNLVSGIIGTTTSTAAFNIARADTATATLSQEVIMENNTVASNAGTPSWLKGIQVANNDYVNLYLSGNRIFDVAVTDYGIWTSGSVAIPTIYFNGDLFNGIVRGAVVADFTPGLIPLYGNNDNGIIQMYKHANIAVTDNAVNNLRDTTNSILTILKNLGLMAAP